MAISIKNKRFFVDENGNDFFWMADTCWAVLFRTEEDEWEDFLKIRKEQGFNVLQVCALPINHDATYPFKYYPYEEKDGKMDFDKINPEFFVRAKRMLSRAVEYGFRICIVALWVDYIKETWISREDPSFIMSEKQIEIYFKYLKETLGGLYDFAFVSGDTGFDSEVTVDSYLHALELFKSINPTVLCSMHINGENYNFPDKFANSPALDFYVFQSGHGSHGQKVIFDMAQHYHNRCPNKPVINSEPCYEGHAHFTEYIRYTERDVRNAFWQSLLGQANAGFTYGAHGVWSWQREEDVFTSEHLSMRPFNWDSAVKLPGAYDLKTMYEIARKYDVFSMKPDTDVVKTDYLNITFGSNDKYFLIYVPVTTPITIALDLSKYNVKLFDLNTKQYCDALYHEAEDSYVIHMAQFNNDYLIIGELK